MLFYSEKVGVAYGQDQFCNTVSFDRLTNLVDFIHVSLFSRWRESDPHA